MLILEGTDPPKGNAQAERCTGGVKINVNGCTVENRGTLRECEMILKQAIDSYRCGNEMLCPYAWRKVKWFR